MLPLRSGWSPLLLAASNGHIDLVKIFLDVNARVDVFDQEARYKHSLIRICLIVDFLFKVLGDHQISIFLRSALHLAAESGNADICEMLLSKNAYVNRYTA